MGHACDMYAEGGGGSVKGTCANCGTADVELNEADLCADCAASSKTDDTESE